MHGQYKITHRLSDIIKERPKRPKHYLLALGLTIFSGVFFGGFLAKTIAYMLEINNLYSPDDLLDYDDD
ncbi:uncharacterized protein Dmoj_GI26678 [Drosophila mojavensis]|uniref:Essential MCU regulator, mitochondrial n=1 Tax=Drosophila mojavensis TaxID=7230 RepID=A0A0Q9X4S4_DROMO|nr:uncharacterized protein Dmoj_GI26678 [Drosophila mojavensis]